MTNILLWDVEATGFPRKLNAPLVSQPEIFELYALILNLESGEVVDGLEIMCKPKNSIPKKIEELLGVKSNDYDEYPSFGSYYPLLKTFFSQVDIWCAHNILYDSKMLIIELARLGKHKDFIYPSVSICTMKMSRSLFPRGKHTLRDLHYRLCGNSPIQTHRAKADTLELKDCVMELYRSGDYDLSGNVKIF